MNWHIAIQVIEVLCTTPGNFIQPLLCEPVGAIRMHFQASLHGPER